MSRALSNMPEISPPGRIAAYTTATCLILSGGAFLYFSWDELTCDPTLPLCSGFTPALGFLTSVAATGALVGGAAIAFVVHRRPVAKGGYSSWTYSLSILFVLGTVAIAGLLPAATCPAGWHLDPLAQLCINASTRFDSKSWIWLKWLIAIGGVAIAATLIHRARWVFLTVPMAAAVWFVGMGWLLSATVGKRVSP